MFEVNKLNDSSMIEQLALFFHNKWGVPVNAYVESMNDSLKSSSGVPAWYYVIHNEEIIAGLGIIENDFHKRKDLRPNICAVYVKEKYQRKGICRKMFDCVFDDLIKHEINDVYLITTHTEFYEHLGFSYYGDIEEDDGGMVRCYHKRLN